MKDFLLLFRLLLIWLECYFVVYVSKPFLNSLLYSNTSLFGMKEWLSEFQTYEI